MKYTKNKLCVFDFDGVIANSVEVGYSIHNSIKDKYNLPSIESRQDYLRTIDNKHLKDFLDDDNIKKYYLETNKSYKDNLGKIEVFPALKELLKKSKEEIMIISSSPDSLIKNILINNEIENVTIYGKEKASTKKERFNLLLEDKKIEKCDIIYIGDTIDDYHFCKQVDIPMIGSNYGYSDLLEIKDSLLELGKQPEELVELIEPFVLTRR